MRASRFFGFSVLRPQTVIREPACPFRAQTELLTMRYSLGTLLDPKGQVGLLLDLDGLWPQRRRTTRSLIARAHDERTKMHDSSESFGDLTLATTDRDTRASLSLPSSNYSEFMIALKSVV
jgi:hypothetical protein